MVQFKKSFKTFFLRQSGGKLIMIYEAMNSIDVVHVACLENRLDSVAYCFTIECHLLVHPVKTCKNMIDQVLRLDRTPIHARQNNRQSSNTHNITIVSSFASSPDQASIKTFAVCRRGKCVSAENS